MARSDPTITMRLPADRLARIDARAKASGMTRTQYVLNRADPEGAHPRATTPEDHANPSVGCPHSKAMQNVLGWGVVCSVEKGGCGTRIR